MNYFQLNALYSLGMTIIATMFVAVSCLTTAQALRKRLTRYLQWSLPFTIGNTLALFNVLWGDWLLFTGTRATLTSGIVTASLVIAAGLIELYGAKRLLDFVRDAPEYRGETLPPRDDAPQTGVWPPPPNDHRSGE